MDELDAAIADPALLDNIGDLDDIMATDLLLQIPKERVGRKICNSCKKLLCAKECFDGNLKTCRGCLRVRRTYQRRKRKKKIEEAIRSDLVSNPTQPLATVNNEACDTGAVPGGHHVPIAEAANAEILRMPN